MSDQRHAPTDDTSGPGTHDDSAAHDGPHDGSHDGPHDDAAPHDDPAPHDPAPLDDVPPVAGGTDDSPPAQGEGASDSW